MGLLQTTFTVAKAKHSEFTIACDKAIDSCKPSAETCVSKTRECYNIIMDMEYITGNGHYCPALHNIFL